MVRIAVATAIIIALTAGSALAWGNAWGTQKKGFSSQNWDKTRRW